MSNTIVVKMVLDAIKDKQNQVNEFLRQRYISDEGDDLIIEFFKHVYNGQLIANSAIVDKVADYCQLLRDEKNFDNFSLEDIEELYRSACLNHPMDIELHLSLFHYLDAVMDQPDEAKQVLSKAVDRMEKRIEEMKLLLIQD